MLKKKKGIKLIAQILTVISVFGIGIAYDFESIKPIKVNAATTSEITINKLTYTYSGTTASLIDVNTTGIVNIPSTIAVNGKNYTVTSIGDYAFEYSGPITSITIPNTVTYLGNNAFERTGIKSITIPSSVTYIGNNCFKDCDFTSIIIPNSVTYMGQAFINCTKLTSITIPNSLTSISSMTFYGCKSLTSVTIPDSVTSIGERAFYQCTSLSSITIPSTKTQVLDGAFANCTGLKSVYIKDNTISMSAICNTAFNGCLNVKTYKVGNTTYTLDYSKLTATTSTKVTGAELPMIVDGKTFTIVHI